MSDGKVWLTFEEAREVVRAWNRRPVGYVAAYDDGADQFAFAAPGRAEQRFGSMVVGIDGVPTRVWCVGAVEW